MNNHNFLVFKDCFEYFRKSVIYFVNNYKVYVPEGERPFMNPKMEIINHVINESLSPLVQKLFVNRLVECKKETKEKIISDLYEYLIIAIRSTSGVHVEIDGYRLITSDGGTSKFAKVT